MMGLGEGTSVRIKVVNEQMGFAQVLAKVRTEVMEEVAASGSLAVLALTIGHTLFAVAAQDYPEEMKPILNELSKLTGMSPDEAAEVATSVPADPKKIITA